MFKKIDSGKKYAEMEKEISKFWKEDKTFEKSVDSRSKDKYYSFYDGPPFITGVPHYGTLLSSIVKDAVPRYWTMKGYRVERRWGWDCHGLPAENMVEKMLGIQSKKEIEEKIGIDKFVQACFDATSKIASEWEEVIDRIGRWVEFKNSYKTMDKTYMESVWWAFKQLYDKGLIYEDTRISLYCPRCSTPLSNFEIAMDNSYEMDKDPSVYVKLKVKNPLNPPLGKGEHKGDLYFIVWTTTPWTLPANVSLAVGGDIDYVKIEKKDEGVGDLVRFILAKDLLAKIFGEDVYTVVEEFKGKDLVGKEYEPIFPHEIENGYKVIAADFVTTEDGTGIVHIAPAFGEDDFQARKQFGLPMILNVDEEGKFAEGEWKGEKVWDANTKIVAWLRDNGYLFKKKNITHSYPHCHRCHTKLIYKAQPAWYVNVAKIRKQLIEQNENINWHPEFLKYGRFAKGIESAPDWNISRDRYWGTGLPVWKCEGNESGIMNHESTGNSCDNIKVVGSYEELKQLSGVELDDYHRPKVDEVTFKCEKCGGTMKRVPQVFDSWIESGSMPFAQFHYPFENKEQFEKSFPTDFISEYIAQTRAWFYVLHVVSVGIFGKESFKNVVTTGTIAGSDGRKMSKSLGNYTLPNIVLEKYSADALRFYLLSSPLLNAQNMNFSEDAIRDIQRRLLGTLWNSYSFFVLYANVDKWEPKQTTSHKLQTTNLLDKWIVSELHKLIGEVDSQMQGYDLVKATKPIEGFVDNLSNWYIRRSRRRFWKSESDADKNAAYETLWYILVEFSKVMAPFCPFVAEEVYRNLMGLNNPSVSSLTLRGDVMESVHLCDFPVADESLIEESVSSKMALVREIVNTGLKERAKSQIKVRQPLSSVDLGSKYYKELADNKEMQEIIKEELNVKAVNLKADLAEDVSINTEITEDLKIEGQMRELVRKIQEARKEAGFEVDNRISVWYKGGSLIFEKFKPEISTEVLADEINSAENSTPEVDFEKTVKVDGEEIQIWLKRV